MNRDYQTRINQVFKYIDENLDGDLSLKVVADIAHFSPYHFHRVFKFISQETLNEYVTRRRIELAASKLIHKEISITEILHKCGFGDNSTFSRTFKKFYGVSPTQFKVQNSNKFSKIRQLNSKNDQEYSDFEKYICVIDNLKKWIKMNAKIEVRKSREIKAAGVTHIGVNGVENAFGKLIKWANAKHLMKNGKVKLGRVFYDSIKITAPDKVRMSVILITDELFEPEGEIEEINVSSSNCIVGRFEITPNEFEKSWTGLFVWMNDQGYKKSENNPFEIYHNDFRTHPENKFIVDLYIPIE